LKTEIQLRIECKDVDTASRLALVLTPDNEGIPRGLRFRMTRQRTNVLFEVGSEKPSTALSTIAAVLNDVTLFQEISLLSPRRDTAA